MLATSPGRAAAGAHLTCRRHTPTADTAHSGWLCGDHPNGNGPPGEESNPEFHGNGALWTLLPPDGIDKAGQAEPDGSTSQKYPWWTVGTAGQLTIRGRRLDPPAPPLRASINSGTPESGFAEVADGRFWASSIDFPTEGCWQVTGTVGHASLTFVVLKTTP